MKVWSDKENYKYIQTNITNIKNDQHVLLKLRDVKQNVYLINIMTIDIYKEFCSVIMIIINK